MCTAISFFADDYYFGRNLDYEYDFGQKVVITPRKFLFNFKNGEILDCHYAIIGMALVEENYPLYFDATNECGLSIAGLNFPGNAVYYEPKSGKTNVASFELIPYLLSKCKNVSEVKNLVVDINITNLAFSKDLQTSPLHWLVSYKDESLTIEQTLQGLKVFDNPFGVLTNNPTFDYHITNLSNYMSVTSNEAQNMFSDKINLKAYSRGMGGIGMPGDLSSASRFVRATFTKLNSPKLQEKHEALNHFFHILYSVYQTKGCAKVGNKYEITNYTSCCSTQKGIYYYTTYNNFTINSVSMHKQDLNTNRLYSFALVQNHEI